MMGLRYNEHGLLWAKDLREHFPPLTNIRYDPAHCLLCSGVAQREMELLSTHLDSVDHASCTWDAIRVFMGAAWLACKAVGGSRAAAKFSAPFSAARQKHFKKTGHFSCQASEMLDLLAPMRLFLATRPACVELDTQKTSFDALCKLVHFYRLCKRSSDAADDFAQAIHDHGLSFAVAYGDDDRLVYIPKFHLLKHVPHQVVQDGLALDTLVQERYHIHSKAVAEHVKNTDNYEKSVLSRALQNHLGLLQVESCFQDGLFQPVVWEEMHAEGHEATIANSMLWAGLRIHIDDIIQVSGGSFTSVRGCVELDGDLGIVVERLHKVEEVNGVASRLQSDGSLRIQKLDGSMLVRFCPAWSVEPDGRILIVDLV